MATKKPLCNYSGSVQEMSSTDIPYSAQVYHGIEAAGALSFDNSSHVLTIASGTNTYWHHGVRYTTSSAITCDLDDYVTLTANTLYYVYFEDATGTLKASASIWYLKLKCPVATVYWNGSAGAVTRETHGHTRNIDWHINAHLTIGARYYSGLDLTKPTTSDDATLTIGSGVIYDEDLAYTIAEQTACRVFYLASSSKYTFADYSLPYPGTSGAPQYLDTDTYTLTAVGSNKYACYWVYATGDISRPIYIVPSAISTPYNTVALARAETPPALTGYGLSPELKLIYRFIYNGDGNFQESADYRTSSSLPSGYIASTTAAAVSFTPSGNVAATNVQTAIEELDTEKSATSHTHSDATTGTAGFMSATDKTKLDGLTGDSGLFEIDIDGGLMPVTDNLTDEYYELDVNNDIMPIAA